MRWKTKTVVRGNDRKIGYNIRAVRINQVIPKRRRVILTRQYAHSGINLAAGTVDAYGTAISLLGATAATCDSSNFGYWETYNTTGAVGSLQPNGRDTMFTLYDAQVVMAIKFHLNVLNCEQSTTFAVVVANTTDTQGVNWSRADFLPPYNKNTQGVRYRQHATIAPTDKIGAFQKTVLNGEIDISHTVGKTRSILFSDSTTYESSGAGPTFVYPTYNVIAMAAEPTAAAAANISYVLTISYDCLFLDAKEISID